MNGFIPYRDLTGTSGIEAYRAGKGFIEVLFRSGRTYRYENGTAGEGAVTEMTRLAKAGAGLNTFINTDPKVRFGYVGYRERG